MNGKVLDDRRQALEDAFFHQENEQLLRRLRNKVARRELADASGISDDAVLADLVELGVDAVSVSALSLVPLVAVAWADREMDERERAAILEAAEQSGIAAGTAAHEALSTWLSKRPPAALFASWQHYAKTSMAGIDAAARKRVCDDVCQRARAVAKAAGGILGIATVSQAEEDTLSEIKKTFA